MGSFFYLWLVVETFSLQKAVKMLEDVVVGWQEVRWICQLRQKFVAQFIQILKHWLYDVWSGIVVKKNWAHSVDQCQLQALQFSVHRINLLSKLLRCYGFAGIQKSVVDQTGSRPPNSDRGLFLVQVWLWEVLWSFFSIQLLSWWPYKIHFSSHIAIWSRNVSLLCRIREDDTSKWWFFYLQSVYEAPTYRAFSLFQFASNAKSTMSSSATSHVAVRGSISMILSIGHCQFTMVSDYTLAGFAELL